MDPTDAEIIDILRRVKRIACVGVSTNQIRPSYYVSRYLTLKGYDVLPVNPAHAGKLIFERTVLPDIASLPDGIDMIDVFRRSEHVPEVVDAALDRFPELDVIWMQIGVAHAEAAAKARARGVTVIENRCPKLEYQRLFGELRLGGFVTGRISSKL